MVTSTPISGHTKYTFQQQFFELCQNSNSDDVADKYGEGALIKNLQEELSRLFGKESSLFMPSGTMAQQIALRIWTERTHHFQVGLHETSHLLQHEHMGLFHLHGLSHTLLGSADRTLSAKDVEVAWQEQKFAAMIIELPQRHNGGMLPSWDELTAISDFCRKNQIKIHLDGARLWECRPYYQRSYQDICGLFDSVYTSFYKGLDAMTGAMLSGSQGFIDEASVWLRRHGGNLYTQTPYVLSAYLGLKKHLELFPKYYEKTLEIASIINSCQNFYTAPKVPHCNMFHLGFNNADKIKDRFALAEKLTAERYEICFGSLIWERAFSNAPISEVYIGESAMNLSPARLKEAITYFDQQL